LIDVRVCVAGIDSVDVCVLVRVWEEEDELLGPELADLVEDLVADGDLDMRAEFVSVAKYVEMDVFEASAVDVFVELGVLQDVLVADPEDDRVIQAVLVKAEELLRLTTLDFVGILEKDGVYVFKDVEDCVSDLYGIVCV